MNKSDSAKDRIVIDVSHSFQTGHNTGIQRVVYHTISALKELGKEYVLIWHPFGSSGGFFDVTSVYHKKTSNLVFEVFKKLIQKNIVKFLLLDKLLNKIKNCKYLKFSVDSIKKLLLIRGGLEHFQVRESDRILILDVFWHDSTLITALEVLSQKGLNLSLFVHDIFPISNPEWFDYETKQIFENSLSRILKITGKVSTSSKSNAYQIRSYLIENKYSIASTKITVIELTASNTKKSVLRQKQERSGILWVGTIEPRKNLSLLLDFVEKYKPVIPIFICGRIGWKSGETVARLEKLDRTGKVIWHKSIDDKRLSDVASQAKIGVITSFNEGFGLPLLEFRNFGLAVVAPKIPVFVELDKGFVNFYEPNDIDSLARICQSTRLKIVNTNNYNIRTWTMFTKELCQFLNIIEVTR